MEESGLHYRGLALMLVYLVVSAGCAGQDRCMRNSDCAPNARCSMGECLVPVSQNDYAGSAGLFQIPRTRGGTGPATPQSGGADSRPPLLGGATSLPSTSQFAGAPTSAGTAGSC